MSRGEHHGHEHDSAGEHQHHHGAHDHGGLGELLDLDAEVLAQALAEVRQDIERIADGPVRRLLDVGAGTGTGTFGLLAHFTDAHAVAVDESEEMLGRLSRRAAELGVADRVSTVRANLDEGVPAFDPVDLIWASASLHHVANPERTLSELAAVLRPGGMLAVVEMSGFPRFVPDDTPGAEAEAAAHGLLSAAQAVDVPTMGSDWGTRLEATGLRVEVDRPIHLDGQAAQSPVLGKYAAASLERVLGIVADRLEPHHRAGLERLVDGSDTDVRRRTDLQVASDRHLWIARRPTDH